MSRTGIPHEDLLQLHFVAAIGWAGIDSMGVVVAATHCIAFNDFDTHDCRRVIASMVYEAENFGNVGGQMQTVFGFGLFF